MENSSKIKYGFQILTENGFKDFDNIKETIRQDNLKIYFKNSFIIVTPEHKFYNRGTFVRAKDIKENDIINNKKVIKIEQNVECSNKFYDLINVQDGHHYTANEIEVSNCAFISNSDWKGISDSVFPAQEALTKKQKILISTPNGMNHWYHLVKQAQKPNSGYEYFSCDWKEVPRYNRKGEKIDPEIYRDEQIKKNGKKWFDQNFELAFLGSSSTLINEDSLRTLDYIDEDLVVYDLLFSQLRIIEKVKQNHNYIIGVDPAKDGIDKTAIQVIDVTSLPFKQVAVSNLDDSYLTIPSKLFDLGNYYNTALIIIENNIDNSIVDTLFYHYEYDGEIYKEKDKNILGFRTTTKTKKVLLSLLKKLIEEDKLIIKDKETIDQLYTFIEQKNGSFSAQDGYHDDLVMSLMVSLAPFIDIKNFDDFKGFVSLIEKRNEELEKEDAEIEHFYSLGFNTEMTDLDINYNNYKKF